MTSKGKKHTFPQVGIRMWKVSGYSASSIWHWKKGKGWHGIPHHCVPIGNICRRGSSFYTINPKDIPQGITVCNYDAIDTELKRIENMLPGLFKRLQKTKQVDKNDQSFFDYIASTMLRTERFQSCLPKLGLINNLHWMFLFEQVLEPNSRVMEELRAMKWGVIDLSEKKEIPLLIGCDSPLTYINRGNGLDIQFPLGPRLIVIGTTRINVELDYDNFNKWRVAFVNLLTATAAFRDIFASESNFCFIELRKGAHDKMRWANQFEYECPFGMSSFDFKEEVWYPIKHRSPK